MPAFALFNAGVPVGGGGTALADPVVLGTFLGLLVGKPVGIVLFAAAAAAAGLTRLPRGVGWAAVTGVGLLGGIGFTMALFIGTLAFGEGPVLNQAKVGVLLASVCALLACTRAEPRPKIAADRFVAVVSAVPVVASSRPAKPPTLDTYGAVRLRIRKGRIQFGSLDCAGFASAATPDFDAMQPMAC